MQQITEGTMRRSKRTGEVQVLQGGQWVPQGGAATSAPALPREIEGPPRQPTPQTPVDAARDEVGLERDRLGLQRDQVELEKLRAGTDAKKASVEQGKAAGFHSRAVKANQIFNGLGVGAPSLGREAAQSVLPEGVVNRFTDDARQQAEALEKDFIAATLRYESGAAIPPQELDSQRRIFFPVAGDSEATVNLKRQLRENIIEALRMGAGDAAIDIPAIQNETVRQQLEQRIASGTPPQETIKWLASIGRPPTPDEVDRIFANAGNTDPNVLPPGGGINVTGLDRAAHNFGVGVRGVVQGAGDVANFVSSPFIQGVNAVAGTNYNPDMGDAAADFLGLPEPQSGGEHIAHQVNRFGTGAMNLAGVARRAAPYVQGATSNALARFGNAPLTDAVAGSSAGAASETTRQMGGGPISQAVAGVAAGGLTLPISSRVNALMETAPQPLPAVSRAGQREGVTVNRVMADPSLQTKATATGKTFVGSRQMHRGMAKSAGEIEGRVQSLGRGENLQEPAAVGNVVQNIGKRYIKASGGEFRQKYGALRTATADVRIAPSESVTHIDSILARLNKAPNQNAAEIKYLEGVKADIAKGIDVETARDIGSRLSRDIAKGDLTFGKAETDVLDIRKALARDTENGLTAAGRANEARQYREVDAAYSQRMAFIQQKLHNLLGRRDRPLDAEKAAGRLNTMAGKRGDASGLFQVLKRATPEELEDIRSTFAHSLGRNKDGSFSTAKLVNDLEAMPTAARVAVFGKEGAKSLDNLKMIAAEHKRVMSALGGSPTALAQDWRGYLYNLILGAVGGGATGNIGTGTAVAAGAVAVKAARDALSARTLLSPKVTGWLRAAPRTSNPKMINAHWDRLKAIAVREPALAPDIHRLEEIIRRTANENTMRGAAASDNRSEESK